MGDLEQPGHAFGKLTMMWRRLAVLSAATLWAVSAHAQAIVSPTGLPANAGTAANPLVTTPTTPSTYGEPKWSFFFGGNTYVASTNSINVPAQQYATVTLCNTSTTKTVYIFRRRFDNNEPAGTTPFLYGGVSGASSTSISSTAAATSNSGPTNASSLSNLVNANPGSTNVAFTYGSGTSTINGTITATGYLPPSTPYELQEPRALAPGTCQAQFANNRTPSATGAAYNVVFTAYWWEQ